MRIRTLTRRTAVLAVTGLLALAAPAWPALADPADPAAATGSSSAPTSGSATAAENVGKPIPMSDSEIGLYKAQLAGQPGFGGNLAPHPTHQFQLGQKGCAAQTQQSGATDSIPWAQRVMRLPQLWSFGTRGAGQRVGIIDTGVNTSNSLFGGRAVGAGDYINGDNGTKDCDGHGTLVAGIIGASAGTGFSGVAPDAQLFSIRTTSTAFQYQDANQQQHNAGDLESMAAAVYTMVDKVNVNEINISLAACPPVSDRDNPDLKFLQAALRYAVNHDVVVVVAAGNTGSQNDPSACQATNSPGNVQNISAPAYFDPDVLSVGSVDKAGDASSFTMAGPWVNIAAPGENITSLNPNGSGIVNQEGDGKGNVGGIQGTSFAAPYVTGLVTLLRAHFPKLSAREIMHRITATAQHPAGDNGRNDQVGNGLIDPVAAMTAVMADNAGTQAPPPRPVFRPLPPAVDPDRVPIMVALVGSGAGLGLLGLTLFIVYTVQRNRRPREVNN